MGHRTQITLTERQYDRLRAESRRTGLPLAELVRRALEALYGAPDRGDADTVLTETAGTWASLDVDGADYVERLRPGLAERLRRVG